jgi:hypothetical protein
MEAAEACSGVVGGTRGWVIGRTRVTGRAPQVLALTRQRVKYGRATAPHTCRRNPAAVDRPSPA